MNTRKKLAPPNFRAGLDFFMAAAMVLFGCFIIFSQEMTGEDYFKNSAFVRGAGKWIIGILFIALWRF